jgi:hypothetical protein
LFGSLTGAEDNFRKAPADLAVVVYASKTQIFKRQMSEFLNCLVDGYFTVFDLP